MAHPGMGDLYYYDKSYKELANWAYVRPKE